MWAVWMLFEQTELRSNKLLKNHLPPETASELLGEGVSVHRPSALLTGNALACQLSCGHFVPVAALRNDSSRTSLAQAMLTKRGGGHRRTDLRPGHQRLPAIAHRLCENPSLAASRPASPPAGPLAAL